MVDSESQLVVIVPTHNRIEKLASCLQSIRSTYVSASIVVGDNSDEDYEKFGSLVEKKFSAEVLDLRSSSGCIGSTYQALVHRCQELQKKFVLIVEDDDILVNPSLHHKILDLLAVKNIDRNVSFGFCQCSKSSGERKRYLCSRDQLKSFKEFPKYWRGKFKFDTMYFKLDSLVYAFDMWLGGKDYAYRAYDGSSDEAIAMLAMSFNGKKIPMHFPEVGLQITKDHTNESLTNPELAAYSSRRYIDDVGELVGLSQTDVAQWKSIQLAELKDDLSKLEFDLLFGSNCQAIQIEKQVSHMIASGVSPKFIKKLIVDRSREVFKEFK